MSKRNCGYTADRQSLVPHTSDMGPPVRRVLLSANAHPVFSFFYGDDDVERKAPTESRA